jgi:hypothetical protein
MKEKHDDPEAFIRRHESTANDESPSSPTLTSSAADALGYLNQIEDTLSTMRGVLFGEGEDASKRTTDPSHLEGLIKLISSRSACLAGELKTILGKL